MVATIRTLPHYFPEVFTQRIILSILILLVLCSVSIVAFMMKRISGLQFVCSLFLSLYLVIVYYFTVIGRYSSEIYRNEIYFIYSYKRLFENINFENISQIAVNLFMLIPVGFFLPIVLTGKKKLLWTILISFSITLSIEILQIVIVCGTFEIDDILNNMLGALIGMILSVLLLNKCKIFNKRK